MEQYGSFGGLDTCNQCEFGHFDKHYILIFDNEDRTIANWYDVNTHLDVLFKQKSYQLKQLILCVTKIKL